MTAVNTVINKHKRRQTGQRLLHLEMGDHLFLAAPVQEAKGGWGHSADWDYTEPQGDGEANADCHNYSKGTRETKCVGGRKTALSPEDGCDERKEG